ncbi:MAG: hypothetical protein OEY28_13585 [Nitrospira sp.]|nr:hypothetical protein [Nitrospira sp.]
MTTMEQRLTHDRLTDLTRVVELLNGQLRTLHQELHQPSNWSSTGQLRSNFLSLRRNRVFMSAICNRRIRPNTKQPSGAVSRTSHGPVSTSPHTGC